MTHTINISKHDSDVINQYLFSPQIVKFIGGSSVCGHLNFPHNWRSWAIPKKLHGRDLKILSFDKTKIIITTI
jgi:hypothetical protein